MCPKLDMRNTQATTSRATLDPPHDRESDPPATTLQRPTLAAVQRSVAVVRKQKGEHHKPNT